jgi:FKBP-type peptidyl-prolyl cis-trans isomerase FklB
MHRYGSFAAALAVVLVGFASNALAQDPPPAAGAAPAAPAQAAPKPAPPEGLPRNSYVMGAFMGKQFFRNGVELDLDSFLRGLKEALANEKHALTDQEMAAVMQNFDQQLAASSAAKAAQAGAAYLDANGKKEGVVTTKSGLQYRILKKGEGKTPGPRDSVVCHYQGTLINGQMFDSSIARGQPATFEVGGVIPGWTEALVQMPVGSKWELVIPAKLAYGAEGRPPVIPANAVLVFEVELLQIIGK